MNGLLKHEEELGGEKLPPKWLKMFCLCCVLVPRTVLVRSLNKLELPTSGLLW